MQLWLSRLFDLSAYSNPIQRRQAVTAYAISAGGLLLVLVAMTAVLIGLASPMPAEDAARLNNVLMGMFIVMVAFAIIWGLIRHRQLTIAKWLLLMAGYGVAFLPALGIGWRTPGALLGTGLVITMAGLLVGGRGVIGVTAACVAGTVIVWLNLQGTAEAREIYANMGSQAGALVGFGLMIYYLAQGWWSSLARTAQETAAQRRQLQLSQLSNEVTERIFLRSKEETLLDETVMLVRDRFEDIYHAQIFLLDEAGINAVLQASTGPIGQQLLQRGHKLAVGSQSVIGQVTQTRQPVLARDTSRDPMHRRNELLPNTRAELALPLISGRQIIGALDVQSTAPNAFTPADIDALQTLANQIAIAIDNARLFTEQQRVIAENQRLVDQAQQQIALIENLNRRLTRSAWASYLDEQDLAPALTIDFASGEMTPNAEWTDSLRDAAAAGGLIQYAEPDRQIIAVPLNIRGEIIGALELELAPDTALRADDAALLQDVADRLSLSLESARLYEDAQRIARREAVINELGARLQSAAGMDGALVTAAQGLQTTLNASRIAIRLGVPSEARPPAENGDRLDHDPANAGNGQTPSDGQARPNDGRAEENDS